MARPSKLTDVLRDKIALLIRAGNTIEVAAEASGIAESTFYEWMDRGEDAKGGRFRDFYLAVEQARAEAESINVVRVSQAARNGSWQAAAWLLERRHPERWAKATDRRKLSDGDNDKPATEDAFGDVDELAPRRQARQGGA